MLVPTITENHRTLVVARGGPSAHLFQGAIVYAVGVLPHMTGNAYGSSHIRKGSVVGVGARGVCPTF